MKERSILTALVLVLATTAVAGGLFFAGALTTQATQAPKMSLDMDPSGNGVSAGPNDINLMTVGAFDRCATENPGDINPGPFPPAPTFSTHLIVEDVEDLVGWQARFNYDGTKVSLSSFNATPFVSSINTAGIGFTNLPFDLGGGVHRGVTSASGVFNPDTSSESAAIGASYLGNPTLPVSPDTPYISDEGTQTYDAPSGGVLAEVIWAIKPAADGDSSIKLDLDDDTPNAPGSQAVVFTGSGTNTINLAESALTDGFLGVNTTCVAPALPTATATSTPTATAVPPGEATPTSTPKSTAPAATQTPVPTPTVLAITQLPTTGGEGGNGGSPAWIYFLATGLVISAAGAFIAQQLRSRERSQRG